MQRFWFIEPEDSIKELMQDPDFVAAFRKERDDAPGSYWGSPEHARMSQATAGAVDDRRNGIIDLGFDFVQPYHFTQHSTGLLFMRQVWYITAVPAES
jgi:hypothetical protein